MDFSFRLFQDHDFAPQSITKPQQQKKKTATETVHQKKLWRATFAVFLLYFVFFREMLTVFCPLLQIALLLRSNITKSTQHTHERKHTRVDASFFASFSLLYFLFLSFSFSLIFFFPSSPLKASPPSCTCSSATTQALQGTLRCRAECDPATFPDTQTAPPHRCAAEAASPTRAGTLVHPAGRCFLAPPPSGRETDRNHDAA